MSFAYSIFPLIVRSMTLRTPRDFVVKPLAYIVMINGVFIGIQHYLYAQPLATQLGYVPIVTLTAVPFMAFVSFIVTKMSNMQDQLADLAATDVLTQLPNRRAFINEVQILKRRGALGFLMIIDADHFKRINDTYGHAVGDICLQAIAKRLDDLREPHDLIGRIGGEEFGAYMPHATVADVQRFGDRLCHNLLVAVPEISNPLRLTMSVGAAETFPKESIENGLQRADEALYVAKNNGRAQLVMWKKSMTDAA